MGLFDQSMGLSVKSIGFSENPWVHPEKAMGFSENPWVHSENPWGSLEIHGFLAILELRGRPFEPRYQGNARFCKGFSDFGIPWAENP